LPRKWRQAETKQTQTARLHTVSFNRAKAHKSFVLYMKTLLTKKEVADRLLVHPNTVDNFVKRGLIKPRRLSQRKLIYVWEEIARDLDI